jgi:hypothetical protein
LGITTGGGSPLLNSRILASEFSEEVSHGR